jgi:hypothetical protein
MVTVSAEARAANVSSAAMTNVHPAKVFPRFIGSPPAVKALFPRRIAPPPGNDTNIGQWGFRESKKIPKISRRYFYG